MRLPVLPEEVSLTVACWHAVRGGEEPVLAACHYKRHICFCSHEPGFAIPILLRSCLPGLSWQVAGKGDIEGVTSRYRIPLLSFSVHLAEASPGSWWNPTGRSRRQARNLRLSLLVQTGNVCWGRWQRSSPFLQVFNFCFSPLYFSLLQRKAWS